MPRLVLYGDDGAERFACDVSERNAQLVGDFVRRHLAGPLEALVVFRRAVSAILEPAELPPAPPRKRRRPRAIAATYTPPPRKPAR